MASQEVSDNTIRSYLSDVRCFFRWYQDIDSSDTFKNITSYHISAYKEHMVHSRRKKTSSVNRNIQSLKNFFHFLVNRRVIRRNPAHRTKYLRRMKRLRPQSLSKKEIHRLLSATSHSMHGTQKRNYAIIQLLLHTGIRVSELTSLESRDVKLYKRSGEIRIVGSKGYKERVVPLNNASRKSLYGYLGEEGLNGRELVFVSKRNERLTSRAVQKVVSNLGRRAKIDHISPHTLRHTFAINYLRSNPDCLVELSGLLGHESLDTTAIYTVASKERLEATLEKSGTYVNE